MAAQGLERRDKARVREVCTVRMDTPLTTALSMLLEAGVSALPVVDEVSLVPCWLLFKCRE